VGVFLFSDKSDTLAKIHHSKGMSKTRIILVILAVALVAFIWAVTSFTNKITETPETFTVGEEFIEHLAAGDPEAASALAVSELQNPESQASLQTLVDGNADILNAQTEVDLTGRGLDNDLRYAYGTVRSGELELPLYMEFVDENGSTRVSYFSFNAEDIPTFTNETAE
jgi:hypothetical protein